jgi:hypothetical protein
METPEAITTAPITMHTIPIVASGFVGRPGGIGSWLDSFVRWKYTAAPPSKNIRPTRISPIAAVATALLLVNVRHHPRKGVKIGL